MNNQEAKFILGAYRPDGRDATDARFAEALAQAERDPQLRAWLEQERRLDAELTRKLNAIAPPPGLREAILAGVRASQPARRWWQQPAWLAAAAAILILALVSVTLRAPSATATPGDLAGLALTDTVEAHDAHVGRPRNLSALQVKLGASGLRLSRNLQLDANDLRQKGCRTVRLAGRDVFEICFERDGAWYHLYAMPRASGARSDASAESLAPITSRAGYASTAWADANFIYALVTDAGSEALRRVI